LAVALYAARFDFAQAPAQPAQQTPAQNRTTV